MSDDTPTGRFTPRDDDREPGGDTPTERFDAASGAPTERFDAQPLPPEEYDATRIFDAPVEHPTELLGAGAAVPASVAGRPVTQRERLDAKAAEPKARGLFYTLIGISAALLIAIIVVLAFAFGPKGDEPVAIPTDTGTPSAPPSETPEPEPTPVESSPPPAPAPTGPVFDSFNAPETSGCLEGETQHPLTFAWSSGTALTAYIGVGTTDAKAAPFEGDLPPIYTYKDISYNCDQASQVYTVTLENADGLLTHKTVTVTK